MDMSKMLHLLCKIEHLSISGTLPTTAHYSCEVELVGYYSTFVQLQLLY